MEPLAYRKMDFEEFCAATISTHQLEAHDRWEDIASTAFEHFEREGNRLISVEELARVIAIFFSRIFKLYVKGPKTTGVVLGLNYGESHHAKILYIQVN